MTERTLNIVNEAGLHSRPADLFVRTAKLYDAKIDVEKDGRHADAKNIIKLILLNVPHGERIVIRADGPDEVAAVEDLGRLVESSFRDINARVAI